jgi:hypothetical protein
MHTRQRVAKIMHQVVQLLNFWFSNISVGHAVGTMLKARNQYQESSWVQRMVDS